MTGNWYNGSKAVFKLHFEIANVTLKTNLIPNTVRLGDKKQFDKEQIGDKEPFPVTKCQFHKDKEQF